MAYSPYTSTFQEFNENQRRKAAKEWLDVGDWIRYGKLPSKIQIRGFTVWFPCLEQNINENS